MRSVPVDLEQSTAPCCITEVDTSVGNAAELGDSLEHLAVGIPGEAGVWAAAIGGSCKARGNDSVQPAAVCESLKTVPQARPPHPVPPAGIGGTPKIAGIIHENRVIDRIAVRSRQ